MKKRFGIIAVTYREYFKESFFYSILEQTCKDFDLHIYHDGEDIQRWEEYIRKSGWSANVFWHNTEKRMNQFGHDLRDLGIKEQADKYEWLIITNCDNYYVPKFLEYLNQSIESNSNAGVVYYHTVHSHNRGDADPAGEYGLLKGVFEPCRLDIGAFATKSSICKELGFKERYNEADAFFISEIKELQKKWKFDIECVDKILFVHN